MPLQEPVLVYAPSLSAATAALGLQAKILGLVETDGAGEGGGTRRLEIVFVRPEPEEHGRDHHAAADA
jgi:hypothetical protein